MLDGEVFGHGFNDPVALSELRQVIFKVAGSNAGGERGIEKCGGPGFGECFKGGEGEAVARAVARRNHVEEKHGNAGVGQVRGDARTHGSSAKHGPAADKHGLGVEIEDRSRGGGNGAHAVSEAETSTRRE